MREIIIISARRQDPDSSGAENIWVCAAFWFPVAVGSEMPIPGPVVYGPSKVPNITQAEADALYAGTVIEIIFNVMLPEASTLATIKTTLTTAYNAQAAKLTGRLNPANFAGSSWDGTVWIRGS